MYNNNNNTALIRAINQLGDYYYFFFFPFSTPTGSFSVFKDNGFDGCNNYHCYTLRLERNGGTDGPAWTHRPEPRWYTYTDCRGPEVFIGIMSPYCVSSTTRRISLRGGRHWIYSLTRMPNTSHISFRLKTHVRITGFHPEKNTNNFYLSVRIMDS